jgi:two-component system phosphate regulon sensor histidine kinase PhoR
LIPDAVTIETVDSTVWDASWRSHTSLLKPNMEVAYPFDILQRHQVVVAYRLSALNAIRNMLLPFGCSLVLSFLLIFCLLYQTKTIFRQQRIEDMRRDFIQTMLHELKRPITTLKFFLSFMKNPQMQQDTALKEDIIRNSHNELDNLSSYFSKLRDVMFADDIPLNMSVFNLKDLLGKCIEKLSLPTDRTVNVNLTCDDIEITADRMHLANVVSNLLENAVKYSVGALQIDVSGIRSGDRCRLEVADSGAGIPEAERNHVFDKFFRGKTTRDIPGIGLGLSYVRLLVEAHGGAVSLESETGRGSRFIIILPIKQ